MKTAVIGSGGREHTLAWKLQQSKEIEKVYVLPGNGGTPDNNVSIDTNDFEALYDFCQSENIGLIVVGPEAPLAAGMVDYFQQKNILVFGPSKTAAQLESSKIFAKQFMKKYGVATGAFWLPQNKEEGIKIIRQLNGNLVIKYDGLAAGKGVFVCHNETEALEALDELYEKYGANDLKYLIEEKLQGQEISIIGITDGKDIKLLHPSQDHKQLLDGDKGPNTGGMGAFCPVPFYMNDKALQESIKKEVIEPTLKGIQAEGFDYKGFLYFGLMITQDGPKVLEYNTRLGDPETEVILPSLESDLAELLLACLKGNLKDVEVKLSTDYFVDVVLASGGYPKKYEKGYPIKGLETVDKKDTFIFHSGTKQEGKGNVLTNGGRVLNVVAKAAGLEAAIEKAYREVKKISFEKMYFRTDIGRRPIPENQQQKSGNRQPERSNIPSEIEPVPRHEGSEGNSAVRDDNRKNIAIFISGRGSNMEAIVRNEALKACANIVFVFSNNPDAKGLKTARDLGIQTACIDSQGKKRRNFDKEVLNLLHHYKIDYIVLAGYMRILSPVLTEAYPNHIINIHPADTKEFKGLGAYEWAYEQGLKETKITVHYVDEGVDTGKIIAQKTVDISDCKTLEEIEQKGLKTEHLFYSEVLCGLFL